VPEDEPCVRGCEIVLKSSILRHASQGASHFTCWRSMNDCGLSEIKPLLSDLPLPNKERKKR
jgi:hypothetical protein